MFSFIFGLGSNSTRNLLNIYDLVTCNCGSCRVAMLKFFFVYGRFKCVDSKDRRRNTRTFLYEKLTMKQAAI